MQYKYTRNTVANRGRPPVQFLNELILWARTAPNEIFEINDNTADIYVSVFNELGPWNGLNHRKAVLLEVLRVLGGFESSWNWNEGVDTNKEEENTPETAEAGLWQISGNSRKWDDKLLKLIINTIGTYDPNKFQSEMKSNHTFAMEYTSRLLRRTVKMHGPILRKEINPWLSQDAVKEFQVFLS